MSNDVETSTDARELLDTMLGYLGFVVQIEETRSEGGNPTLQIYTEEADRLIGGVRDLVSDQVTKADGLGTVRAHLQATWR